MATLQELKKKLRGIKSTEKLTKAMKTVSAAKYSKLNRLFGAYSSYSDSCLELYKQYEGEVNSFLPPMDASAPPAVFIFSSNKGMCGGFNTEILNFAVQTLKELPADTLIFPCGKRAVNYFTDRKQAFEKAFVFSDIPSAQEAQDFLGEILSLRKDGKISSVFVIYPNYRNVMIQQPRIKEIFTAQKTDEEASEDAAVLFVPDRKTVMKSIAEKVIFAAVYGILLETALGAQASTLTTMRSAYDTATQYSAILQTQINRKRQSEVTSDVLETSREVN